MPLRFTSPTYPAALITMLNDHDIGLDKKGRDPGPYQITVKSAHAQARNTGKLPLTSKQTKDLLNSLETDTVVEILDYASTEIASTVVKQLPSKAILDIGKDLQNKPDSSVKKDQPHCTLLGDLPPGSRVLLRKDLTDRLKDTNVSISAITSRFHGKLIGVFIDPDKAKPMKPDNIASINLSSDCFVYLNDALSDKIITALGMNQSIRNFDVTQLSGSNCEKLQKIIEGRDHIVELRCNTAEQRHVFHNKPGVTILMPGAIQSNPLSKDRDAALALLDLQIQDEKEGPDNPQAQPVTLSRKSRLPSPDSVVKDIHDDTPSEHANNKKQRRMSVTPDHVIDLTGDKESDAPAKEDDETIGPNRLRNDDAVSANTWCDDDYIDEDEYTDDTNEPSPSPK